MQKIRAFELNPDKAGTCPSRECHRVRRTSERRTGGLRVAYQGAPVECLRPIRGHVHRRSERTVGKHDIGIRQSLIYKGQITIGDGDSGNIAGVAQVQLPPRSELAVRMGDIIVGEAIDCICSRHRFVKL